MKKKPMFFRPLQDRDLPKGDIKYNKQNGNGSGSEGDNMNEYIENTIQCILDKYQKLTSGELRDFHRKSLGCIVNNMNEAETHLRSNATTIKSVDYINTELDNFIYKNNISNVKDFNNNNNDGKNEDDYKDEQKQLDKEYEEQNKDEDEDNIPKKMDVKDIQEAEQQEADDVSNLTQIKQKLEVFLDRLSIVELKCDGFTERFDVLENTIGNVETNINKVADIIKVMDTNIHKINSLYENLKNGNGNGNDGIGNIITIKYDDPLKKDKQIKDVVFNSEFKKALELCSSRMNVLLTGASGCGKTHMASMLADALDLRFGSQSCSEGMDESVFAGTLLPINDGNFEYVSSLFVDFYENGGLFLIDEGDAADANLMIFINSALGNKQFHLPRRWKNPLIKRHKDFVCVMATNTIGHGGDDTYLRNQLDGATLDRFRAGIIKMDYSEKVEISLVDEEVYTWCKMIRDGIRAMQMPRIMSTRVMLDFTKLKVQQNWTIKQMSESYFMDWRPDDKKRLDTYIKGEVEKLKQKIQQAQV